MKARAGRKKKKRKNQLFRKNKKPCWLFTAFCYDEIMKESQIRKKAIELLNKSNWVCWFPKKIKFQETDIFGCYDILAVKKNKLRFIQITTLSNLSARRKKIEKFLISNEVNILSEVWAYDKKKRKFKIVKV